MVSIGVDDMSSTILGMWQHQGHVAAHHLTYIPLASCIRLHSFPTAAGIAYCFDAYIDVHLQLFNIYFD